MSVLVCVPPKQTLKTGVQVQILYLGADRRKHGWGNEKVGQRREGNHKRVCWRVLSYYMDSWSSDLLGTPGGNVEGASGLAPAYG